MTWLIRLWRSLTGRRPAVNEMEYLPTPKVDITLLNRKARRQLGNRFKTRIPGRVMPYVKA